MSHTEAVLDSARLMVTPDPLEPIPSCEPADPPPTPVGHDEGLARVKHFGRSPSTEVENEVMKFYASIHFDEPVVTRKQQQQPFDQRNPAWVLTANVQGNTFTAVGNSEGRMNVRPGPRSPTHEPTPPPSPSPSSVADSQMRAPSSIYGETIGPGIVYYSNHGKFHNPFDVDSDPNAWPDESNGFPDDWDTDWDVDSVDEESDDKDNQGPHDPFVCKNPTLIKYSYTLYPFCLCGPLPLGHLSGSASTTEGLQDELFGALSRLRMASKAMDGDVLAWTLRAISSLEIHAHNVVEMARKIERRLGYLERYVVPVVSSDEEQVDAAYLLRLENRLLALERVMKPLVLACEAREKKEHEARERLCEVREVREAQRWADREAIERQVSDEVPAVSDAVTWS